MSDDTQDMINKTLNEYYRHLARVKIYWNIMIVLGVVAICIGWVFLG